MSHVTYTNTLVTSESDLSTYLGLIPSNSGAFKLYPSYMTPISQILWNFTPLGGYKYTITSAYADKPGTTYYWKCNYDPNRTNNKVEITTTTDVSSICSDNRNQFLLDGQQQKFSINPQVAPTKYVQYTGSQQLPLLDSPKADGSTIFDLQEKSVDPLLMLTTRQWQYLVILSAGSIMLYFYKLQMN